MAPPPNVDASARLVVELAAPPAEPGVTVVPEAYDAHQAQKGEGLSLSVCDAIIREHDGSIVHENLADGRRMFRVDLPAIARHPAAVSAAIPTADTAS